MFSLSFGSDQRADMFGLFASRGAREIRPFLQGASDFATKIVLDQKTEAERSFRIDCENDRPMRLVIDDFLVGYAVGLATYQLKSRGLNTKNTPMGELLALLQSGLGPSFPGLSFDQTYTGYSPPLSCGIYFGVHDPAIPTGCKALWRVWGELGSDFGPVNLANFAVENFGLSGDTYLGVKATFQELRSRLSYARETSQK